jgi:hypothetical protein
LHSYLGLSIIGALFIILFAILGSSENANIKIFDKLIIGLAFIISCILGISLAFKPNWIKTSLETQSNKLKSKQNQLHIQREGHHPICGQFTSHTIKINDRLYCAGCTGLTIGAIIACILMVVYIVLQFSIPMFISYFIMLVGMVLITLNYLSILFHYKNAQLQLLSSMLLIIGFFLIIIGIFQVTGDIIYGLFGVIISFLWLDTRIQLSYWRHTKLCNNCQETCKAYLA